MNPPGLSLAAYTQRWLPALEVANELQTAQMRLIDAELDPRSSSYLPMLPEGSDQSFDKESADSEVCLLVTCPVSI